MEFKKAINYVLGLRSDVKEFYVWSDRILPTVFTQGMSRRKISAYNLCTLVSHPSILLIKKCPKCEFLKDNVGGTKMSQEQPHFEH